MNSEHARNTLNLIGKIYTNILEDASTAYVLPQAIARVEETKKYYDYAKRNITRGIEIKPWGYTIDHDAPLRFKKSEIRKLNLQVDVYCDIKWEEDDIPVKQDIKVRIWCEHSETIYRQDYDSPEIAKKINSYDRNPAGRVVSRFHFDKVIQGQDDKSNPGSIEYFPEYHLQIGGKPEDYELCWHPKKVNVPRLLYHPMELFLTCQMVAASFFPKQYLDIKRKSDWQSQLFWYQEKLLKGYYEKCLDAIKNNESLLDALKL